MISHSVFPRTLHEGIFSSRKNFRIDLKLQKKMNLTERSMSSFPQSDAQNQANLSQSSISPQQNKIKSSSTKAESSLFQTFNKETQGLSTGFHIVHVQSTLNNTLLTLTNLQGQVLSWSSAGSAGFKNARKSTSYAAQAAAEKLSKYCLSHNIKKIHVKLKGLGYGKEACLKGLQMNGVFIQKIEDVTSIAHNGCRLPKKRRM